MSERNKGIVAIGNIFQCTNCFQHLVLCLISLKLKSISFPSLEPVLVEYNDISEISYGDPTLNIESCADPIGVISFKKKLSPLATLAPMYRSGWGFVYLPVYMAKAGNGSFLHQDRFTIKTGLYVRPYGIYVYIMTRSFLSSSTAVDMHLLTSQSLPYTIKFHVTQIKSMN